MENSLFWGGEGILKQYTPKRFRLVGIKYTHLLARKPIIKSARCEVNDEKISQSLSRTRKVIWELGICNRWQYFVTLTLSSKGHDRSSLDAFKKQLSKWLNNYNARRNTQIKYLLIPEPHKDGAWHMHGLFMGIPLEHLRRFTLQDKIPTKIKDFIRKGRALYNWPLYSKAFGWVVVEAIRDSEACAKYITKYITKELLHTRVKLNDHLYYCSLGLKRAQEAYRDAIFNPFEPDYMNEFVAVKDFTDLSAAMACFYVSEVDSWELEKSTWAPLDDADDDENWEYIFRKPFVPLTGDQLKMDP